MPILKYSCVLVVIFLMVGCGDSHKNNQNTQAASSSSGASASTTGIFLNGTIEGLFYEGPNHSGFTTNKGEFIYDEGDTVKFSISGIVLGSAIGQLNLSPVDFFNAALPEGEKAIRYELENTNNVSDFDRLANIMLILVSLDKDSNVINGIEINREIVLSESDNLNFNANLYKFYYNNFRNISRKMNFGEKIKIVDSLNFLYESLGIELESSRLESINVDTSLDQKTNNKTNFKYNSLGNVVIISVDTDVNDNFKFNRLYTYDENNNKKSYNDVYCGSDGTQVFFEAEYRYNNNNNLIYSSYNDLITSSHGEGFIEYSYDFNNNGTLAFSTFYDSGAFFELPWNEIVEYFYNVNGQPYLVKRSTEYESRQEYEYGYTYSPNGLLQKFTFESVNNEEPFDVAATVIIYDYDERGYLLARSESKGVKEYNDTSRSSTAYSYNESMDLIQKTTNHEIFGDNPKISLEKYTYTYNKNGAINTITYGSDRNNDGIFKTMSISQYLYNNESYGIPYLINKYNVNNLNSLSIFKEFYFF